MVLSDLLQIKEKELAGRKKIVLRCCMAASCISSNSQGVKDSLERAVAEAGLQNEVEIRSVGCMRLCCEGPLVQADPQNALYVKVTAENAPSIIAVLKGGQAEAVQTDPNSAFFKSSFALFSPTAASWTRNASKAISRGTVTRDCIRR